MPRKLKRFIELDLNEDSLDGKTVYAAQKQSEAGRALVDRINANPGLLWFCEENVDIGTVKDCCEKIMSRKERNTRDFKLARQILKMINEPRNIAEKKRSPRARR